MHLHHLLTTQQLCSTIQPDLTAELPVAHRACSMSPHHSMHTPVIAALHSMVTCSSSSRNSSTATRTHMSLQRNKPYVRGGLTVQVLSSVSSNAICNSPRWAALHSPGLGLPQGSLGRRAGVPPGPGHPHQVRVLDDMLYIRNIASHVQGQGNQDVCIACKPCSNL